MRGGKARNGVFFAAVATAAVLAVGSGAAFGTLLGIGAVHYPATAGPPVGGVPIAGGIPVPFATATYSGSLTTTVYAGDPTNPLGGLTFTFVLGNNAGSSNVLERLTLNGYTGFVVDAAYVAPPTGVIPSYADRQVADVIGFGFLPVPLGVGVLLPGTTSDVLVLRTNAPSYVATTASVIDGTVATVSTFSPAVPEPSVLVLMVIGLFCGCPRRR